MSPIKRKGVTKGDIVKALQQHDNVLQNMYRHILLIDDVLAKYIDMKKDGNALADFMKPKEEEEKKNGEHKQPKRKRSRGNATTSKK